MKLRSIVLWLLLLISARPENLPAQEASAGDGTDLLGMAESDPTAGRGGLHLPFSIQGYLRSDFRASLEDPYTFERNDNILNTALHFDGGEKIGARASFEIVYSGFSRVEEINDLASRERVDPFRIESEELYLDLYGWPFSWLDLRIGKQTLVWGTADQFNPTDNLNPDDFEDPLEFGKNIANNMIRADAYFGENTLTLVVVPVFKPAQIPPTTPEIFQASPQGAQIIDVTFANALALFPQEVQELAAESLHVTFAEDADFDLQLRPLLPEPSLGNAMFGARFQSRIGNVDGSLSYFYGRDDLPFLAHSFTESFEIPPEGVEIVQNGAGEIEEVNLTIEAISGEVELVYPRYHVVGADLTTSLPFLFDMGFWAEGGLFLPEHLDTVIAYNDPLTPQDAPPTEVVIPFLDDPFVKFTVGFDYTFDSGLYANVQFIHGFFDELGNEQIDDYVFAGMDKYFLSDTLLTRIFAGIDVNDRSYLVFPEITWTPMDAVSFIVGAIVYRGAPLSKFGQPSAGKDTLHLKVQYSF